jgi:hypothetical protein
VGGPAPPGRDGAGRAPHPAPGGHPGGLWNGNREPWSNLYSLDPTRSIVAWSWTQRHKYRDRFASAMTDPEWDHIAFVPVRTRADRRRLLAAAEAADAAPSARPGQLDEQVP